MAQVQILINGRAYQIACDDGQEEHVRQLADYVEGKVAGLVASLGQIGDARLLVMASLLLADELADAYAQLEDQQAGSTPAAGPPTASVAEENALAEAIDSLAQRIEDIAARLEAA